MKTLKYWHQLKPLLNKSSFNAAEAKKIGVPASSLSYYVKSGRLQRLSKGIYKDINHHMEIDFQWEDLVMTANTVHDGVVCLISALSWYDLTEEIMREYWIAIPNKKKAPYRKNTKIIRMRNMDIGINHLPIGKNETLTIFDQERTIVDAFRFLSKEIAIKALKKGLYEHRNHQKIDLNRLQQYAKKLRVNIEPFVLALTTQ